MGIENFIGKSTNISFLLLFKKSD